MYVYALPHAIVTGPVRVPPEPRPIMIRIVITIKQSNNNNNTYNDDNNNEGEGGRLNHGEADRDLVRQEGERPPWLGVCVYIYIYNYI